MIIYNQTKTEVLDFYDPSLGYIVPDGVTEDGKQIYVFIPYSEEEVRNNLIEDLRRDREFICFPVINRGVLWYNTLTEQQRIELNNWYLAWLDVTETRIVPQKPNWLK